MSFGSKFKWKMFVNIRKFYYILVSVIVRYTVTNCNVRILNKKSAIGIAFLLQDAQFCTNDKMICEKCFVQQV